MRLFVFVCSSLTFSVAMCEERIKAVNNSEETAVRDAVASVARAFTAEDVGAYQACFKESRRSSVRRKAALLFADSKCSMEIVEVHVIDVGEDRAEAAVKYKIAGVGRPQEVLAEVSFVKEDGGWRIDREDIKSQNAARSPKATFDVAAAPINPGREFAIGPDGGIPGAEWDSYDPDPDRISPNLHHLMGDIGMREGMGCSGGRCANGRCEIR